MTVYVIEMLFDNQIRYWDGTSASLLGWDADISKAICFLSADQASIVHYSLLGKLGRVTAVELESEAT